MISFRSLIRLSIVMATLAAWPAFAQIAGPPPARIGNVWDGRDHEPNPAAVASNLKSLGYAPKPARERVVTDEVEDIYQHLIQDEATHSQATASRGPRSPTERQPSRSSLQ
jgi:hypothetical protein